MIYQATQASLDMHTVPEWYSDAKLGIFVHWGLFSIPAFARRTDDDFNSFMQDLTAMKDVGGDIPYAEWYLNSLRIQGSATARYHEATYGKNFSYFDFQPLFEEHAQSVDFMQWADLFRDIGAKYVVMVTKHLDGYSLWPTSVQHPTKPDGYYSKQDLVGQLTAAVRADGMKMGLYYAGGVDWTFIETPIRTMPDLMQHQALGQTYSAYAAAQWLELIERYKPALLWNDMGFPQDYDPQQLFAHYYNTIEDGAVNDRWSHTKLPTNPFVRALYLQFIGVSLRVLNASGRELPQPPLDFHYDIETHEYRALDAISEKKWELTRAIGNSFGYNAQERTSDMLTGSALIHMLTDVVSKNGNLLINVGPTGDGAIPDMQRQPLVELGQWLKINGEAIYGTRCWTRAEGTTSANQPVRFTRNSEYLFAIVNAGEIASSLTIKDVPLQDTSRISLLGSDVENLPWERSGSDSTIMLPRDIPAQHAYTFKIARG